ncbi:GntR family transcriptional regulator [Deinococcus phoenicis]|uniref:GntR family transcriptional regulator n=1 Tax=Deinococcus phoenicis TaxID=1476583 RepID=A0A016QN07_9DEIO|nr:GntR family transcriptional regulator [Deinococcus phoenicis]EYB67272.1 GntR family transcriptional regulator [Deinococcus phoenicis]
MTEDVTQRRYLQVQQRLQNMLEGGEYLPGDKVPSERELAQTLGVSRMTVRRAVDNLVRQGLLERDSTTGTRVSPPKVRRLLNHAHLHSITQMVAATGGRAGGKLLEFQMTAASGSVGQKLHLPPGSPVVMIRRLRLVDDVPFCLETSYLSARRVPGLAAEDLLGGESLYQLLEERFGIVAALGESMIGVAPARASEAQALNLQPDQAVLLYRSVVQDARGQPFEYLKSVNHPQLVVFNIGEGRAGSSL